MADLNVQPKKKTNILPWILLLLGVAALIWFLTRDRDDVDTTPVTTDTVATTTTTTTNAAMADGTDADWNNVDFNAPAANYDEVTNRDIAVRGNEAYGIYGLDETILFDEGKATIRSSAEGDLKQVVSSINKRYNNGAVRIYGFADAQGTEASNQELASQRANAVKDWLQNNGIDASRISVNAVGEGQPVATNNTEAGRQQNRRVEIVARNGNTATQ